MSSIIIILEPFTIFYTYDIISCDSLLLNKRKLKRTKNKNKRNKLYKIKIKLD